MTSKARLDRLRLSARTTVFATLLASSVVVAGVPAGASADVVANTSFQPSGAPVAFGYSADSGRPYDAVRGSGWVRRDSLGGPAHVPLDISSNAVERNLTLDRRADTFIELRSARGATRPVR